MNYFAELETKYFENYLSLIKTTIENDSKKLKEKGQKIEDSGVKPFTDEEGNHWDPYDDFLDDAFDLNNMEQLMYRTYVIGILVFIEDQINNVCILIERADKLIFSYKDLDGQGVGRAIKYLKTVTKKDFPDNAETKSHFYIARIIRNSLVHDDGKITKKERTEIEKYIAKYPDMMSFTQTHEIKITYDYAKSLIDLCKKINLELSLYDKPLW